MKKVAEVKYPNSAGLFQFCRRVLDHKFGGIRVIDQDVGQILGFDPADCSHWKKGKKNIRSIQAMKSIADHLGVDEKLVVDVAAGEIDDHEAFYEYSGYGAFAVENKIFETAKKEFYRKHAGSWTKEREAEFRETFQPNEAYIDEIVEKIHATIRFEEAPLYLPEVISHYSQIQLNPRPESVADAAEPVTVQIDADQCRIEYEAGTEMKPYMRFRIAKAMGEYFLRDMARPDGEEMAEYGRHLLDVTTNIFAAKLLTPANQIRKEMSQVNVSRDVVSQLAEVFWVSRPFMNRRLKDILQNSAKI